MGMSGNSLANDFTQKRATSHFCLDTECNSFANASTIFQAGQMVSILFDTAGPTRELFSSPDTEPLCFMIIGQHEKACPSGWQISLRLKRGVIYTGPLPEAAGSIIMLFGRAVENRSLIQTKDRLPVVWFSSRIRLQSRYNASFLKTRWVYIGAAGLGGLLGLCIIVCLIRKGMNSMQNRKIKSEHEYLLRDSLADESLIMTTSLDVQPSFTSFGRLPLKSGRLSGLEMAEMPDNGDQGQWRLGNHELAFK
jgi:hypothetical protein